MKNKFQNIIRRIKYWFYEDDWNIGIVEADIEKILNDSNLEVKWLEKKPDDCFLADPFGLASLNENIFLCEYLSFQERVGKIVRIKTNNSFEIESMEEIISTENHLSFPFLYHENEDIFCLPECFESNAIPVYKFSEKNFPDQFESTEPMFAGTPVLDPVLFKYGEKYWLFFTISGEHSNEKLYLYYSDKIDGQWQPHKKNPVKTDIGSSRGAGSVFIYNDEIYRPAQNCEREYGYGITINKITKLSETEFEEIEINQIIPSDNSKYPDGIHTISEFGKYFLVDGKRVIFRPKKFITLLKKKFKK